MLVAAADDDRLVGDPVAIASAYNAPIAGSFFTTQPTTVP